MRRRSEFATLSLRMAMVLGCCSALAEDWPNFRGPNHDGISRERGLKTDWTTPLKLIWERKVGAAFSSFACVGDRAFTCGTVDKRQTLFCLNADTGEVIWQRPFEEEYIERQGGDGTRATPTVSDGLAYIMGPRGTLVCYQVSDGTEKWRRKFDNPPQWGFSGSTLIEGDMAIVAAGGKSGALVALNRKTGEPVWKCGTDPVSYATPYPFTLNGKRYVAGFMGKVALIADAATGAEVWRMPWQTAWDVNAAAPIYHEGHLFFTSGYNHGATLVKLRADGDKLASDQVWENKSILGKFQSCILHEGHLYVSDERDLKCVEFRTGEITWRERNITNATVVLADGHLYVLSETGELLIASVSPKDFTPLTRAEILSGRCWSVPVLYRGRVYARDMERLVCFSLTPP